MTAPQEKHVVMAVKTISPLAASSATVVKDPIVKKASLGVKPLSSGLVTKKVATTNVVKKPTGTVKKTTTSGAPTLKRKLDSTSKPISSSASSTPLKKPKVSSAVVPKKVGGVAPKKKIAGDSCEVDEPRSDDENDDGSDLKGFLIDDDDEEDGYSSEEELKKVEARSFPSVEKYRMEMEKVKALLGSREKRLKFLKENPNVFKEDLDS